MTQNEFETLTGIKVTFEEYEVANAMYMTDNDTDKQTFCEMFVKMNLINYVREQAEYTAQLRREVKELQDKVEIIGASHIKNISNKDSVINSLIQQKNDIESDNDEFLADLVEAVHNTGEILILLKQKLGVIKYFEILKDRAITPASEDIDIIIDELKQAEMKQFNYVR